MKHKLKKKKATDKEYFWVGSAGKWSYYENEYGLTWTNNLNDVSVKTCGAFSLSKFGLGECSFKLPYIC